MAEEMFYYCETCKKPVSARQMFCDGCRRRFGNAPKYTMEQIEAKQQPAEIIVEEKKETATPKATIEENVEKGARLQCPICQKSYDVNHTVCDDCGLPLVMIYDPVVVPEEEGATESGLIFGAEIQTPTWALNVKRFTDNMADGVKTIVVNHTIMPMGRRYLVENNVFSTDMMAVAQSLKKVSTDNAFFIVEDEALYIQYDATKLHDKNGGKKAAIKINGEMLLPNTRKRLTVHDRITFGYVQQSNMEGCVQFDVVPYGDDTLSKEAAVEMQKMLGEIAEDVRAAKANQEILKKQSDIILEKEDKILEKVYEISDLKVTNYEKDEFDKYFKVLEAYERQNRDEGKSKESYIMQFFGGHERTDDFIAMLTEKQKYYIYSAAFFEEKAQEHDGEGLDYSASAICLGKALEVFANDILMKLLKKFKQRAWEALVPDVSLENSHALGDILTHFAFKSNGTTCANQKMMEKMAKAYRENKPNSTFKELVQEMGQPFVDCDIARGHRNFAAHLNPVPYEKYMEAKNHFLNTEYMLKIYEYCKVLT